MTLKKLIKELDFVTSSIVLVVMTPFLIAFGVAWDWDVFFVWLIIEFFLYVATLFSNVLHYWP